MGRSLLLIVSELLANAICWIVAGIVFGKHDNAQPFLSLALLAWVRLSFNSRCIFSDCYHNRQSG